MLYDQYESKMKKLAVIKNFIVRNRRYIYCSLFILIGITFIILSTRGRFENEIVINDTFIYGETITFEGVDVNSDTEVYYQYALKGSNEWTTEKPTVPGEYQIRAVSKDGFGASNYSEIKVFTIVPVEANIWINNTSIEYGNNPEVLANLLYEDRIDVNSIDMEITNNLTNTSLEPILK